MGIQQQLLAYGAAAGPTTYFYDTFTGANGTNLTAHTPNVGSAWSYNAGPFTIQSNKASCTADSLASVDMGHADGTITVDLNSPSLNNDAVVFRKVDTSNYWRFQVNAIGGPGLTTAYLIDTTSGSDNIVASAGFTMSAGLNTWKLVLSGTSITGYINGVSVISATSSVRQTSTIHGFASSNAGGTGGTTADDFLFVP